MPKRGVTLETTRQVLLGFPAVEEGPCYGTPGFRVRGKFLARLRDDGKTLVVKCGDVERDLRMQADPDTFFTTDHYRGYPTVLIRLASVARDDLHDVVEVAWRRSASKRLLATFDRAREK
ncbi:MAG: MmcQ/YjbR family DNA-binding protein [Gemmatimonadaceae bacterium]